VKNLVILGSTGSIGRSTLAVVSRFPDRLRVLALAGGSNTELLAEQVRRFRPEAVAVGNGDPCDELLLACSESGSRFVRGEDALAELAVLDSADIVVAAMVGAVGLGPAIKAAEAGKRIALANKEVLVMAGELVMRAAADSGAEILPIDSEHNAIFQCLEGRSRKVLRRVLLCATGGPLLHRSSEELADVTASEALNHPRWSMGRKVTIDSATMMNKGFEMIEARWLFDLEPRQISVVVHPQAVVHSLVELVDGTMIAQLGRADMEMPIQYCLSYPERWETETKLLSLTSVSPLEFVEPDLAKFPALVLAESALNAADEEAVEAFLKGRIPFNMMMQVVAAVMERHAAHGEAGLEDILEADSWARSAAAEVIAASAGERK